MPREGNEVEIRPLIDGMCWWESHGADEPRPPGYQGVMLVIPTMPMTVALCPVGVPAGASWRGY